MSTFVWCELVCSACASTYGGCYTSGTVPRKRLKKEAGANGWVFKMDQAFCGEACKNKWEAGQ